MQFEFVFIIEKITYSINQGKKAKQLRETAAGGKDE